MVRIIEAPLRGNTKGGLRDDHRRNLVRYSDINAYRGAISMTDKHPLITVLEALDDPASDWVEQSDSWIVRDNRRKQAITELQAWIDKVRKLELDAVVGWPYPDCIKDSAQERCYLIYYEAAKLLQGLEGE